LFSFFYLSPSSKGMVMALQDSMTTERSNDTPAQRRSLRGFAAMDPQRQREIASLGGRAAHQSGHAHEFSSEEARAAGRKRHARNGSTGEKG
jgi:uncharacterized protein